MAYSLKFGSYTFPAGFSAAEDSLERAIPVAKLPRAHGARTLTGYAKEKTVLVHGGIIKGPLDSSAWRTRLDALKAALAAGPADLYIETDRYYRCMQASLHLPFGPTGYGRIAVDMVITFIGPDPRAFDTTVNTDTWTTPADGTTRTITAGGNAFADPVISCTVGGAGVHAILIAITNNTNGKSMTLSGSVTAGDVIVVNSKDKTVTIAGADRMDLLTAGSQFLTFEVGANVVLYDLTTSLFTSIVSVWQNRYW